MEEYNFGDFVNGDKHSRNFSVSVVKKQSKSIVPTTIVPATGSTTRVEEQETTENFEVDGVESTTIVEIGSHTTEEPMISTVIVETLAAVQEEKKSVG